MTRSCWLLVGSLLVACGGGGQGGDDGGPGDDADAAVAPTEDAGPTTPDADLSGTVVFEASFQSGDLPDNLGYQRPNAAATTVVTAPWDPARKALRLIAREGDDTNGSGYPRTEAVPLGDGDSWAFSLEWGRRYRYRSAFYFPAGSSFPQGAIVAVFQLHDAGCANTSPPLGFYVEDGNLRLHLYRPETGPDTWHELGPVPLGRRVPFEIDYTGQRDGDSRIRISVDDAVVVDVSEPNNVAACDDAGYLKTGLYDWANRIEGQLDLYIDDITVVVD
jgi:hypothetical protein